MKTCKTLSTLVLGLAICALANSQPASPGAADAKRIDALVKQLGSSRYVEREQAQKELEGIGAPALDTLRKAAKEGDAEIAKRAADMVRRLEDKINTDTLLAPKKVKLSFKDVPVAEAVAELAKQSGYVVTLENAAALANRKVTLETGEVSFFEALDKLCAKAGLVEKSQPGFTVGPNPGIIRPGVKIRPGGPVPGVVPQPGVVPPKVLPIQPKAPAAPALPQIQGQLGQPDIADIVKALQAQVQGPQQVPPGQQPEIDQALKQVEALMQARQALMQAQIAQIQAQIQAQQIPGVPQIQIAPLPAFPQIQPFPQPFPGFPGQNPGFGPAQQQPRQFVLADGKPTEYPTSYFGAVRVRLLPAGPNAKAQAGETLMLMEVTAEPRLQNFQITSSPSIVRALDDQGQLLAAIEQPANNNPNFGQPNPPPFAFPNPFNQIGNQNNQQRTFPIRLKLGEKQAKSLKELEGTMTVSVQLPPAPVATINNVLKAAGESAKHKDTNNVALTLQSIEKVGDNGYKLQIVLDGNAANGQIPGGGGVQIIGGGQIQIQIGAGAGFVGPGMNQNLPSLVDAKGNAYKAGPITNNAMQFNNGVIKRTITLEYRADAGQGEPAQLVVNETRNTTLAVPFSFKNVQLP